MHPRASGRLPVILMSSFGTSESQHRAREAGAFAFLSKPFDLLELVALLEATHRDVPPERTP